MVGIRKLLVFLVFFFFLGFLFPRPSAAFDMGDILTNEKSIIVKIQESFEYVFAFKVENKVQVLEKHAEKRLVMAEGYADQGNVGRVENVLQNYAEIKERQINLLGKIGDDEGVRNMVEEKVVEQQKTMEEIKNKIDGDQKQVVIDVQEQVVNQVAKNIIEVNGPEGATEFLNNVVHVWAPGTGPGGGDAGVVYAGGGKVTYAEGTGPGAGGVVIEGGSIQFATGTSMGGSGADIKTVDVKTGGGPESVVENPNPGNTSGEAADPGTDDTRTWIDP